MIVRATKVEEWERLRTLRLRSLAADPAAFGATLAEEEAMPEEKWRERAAESPTRATLVAIDEQGAWLATCAVTVDGPEANLWAMWVAPEARGRGAARALLDASVDRARAAGASHLALWVNVAQARAVTIYERAGFAASGPPMRGTRDSTREFLPMKRAL